MKYKKRNKYFFAVVIVFAMVFSYTNLPGYVTDVYAEEGDATKDDENETGNETTLIKVDAVCGQTLFEIELPEEYSQYIWDNPEQVLSAEQDEEGLTKSYNATHTTIDEDGVEVSDTIVVSVNIKHKWSEKTIDETPATCTEPGKKKYVCQNDESHIYIKLLPKLSHTKKYIEAKKPNCTEKGNKEYWYCTVCNKSFEDDAEKIEIEKTNLIIPATGHILNKTDMKKADCISDGNDAYWQCVSCKNYYSDGNAKNMIKENSWIIKAHHSLTYVEAKDATEKANGEGNSEYWSCGVCKKYFSDEGVTQIEKDSWIIPYIKKSYSIVLGKSVKLNKIMLNGSSTFERMTIDNKSKYQKYLVINEKSGKIKTNKYYNKKISSSVTVKIKANGIEYPVKLNISLPNPVTISRKKISLNGISGYKYTIHYNLKNVKNLNIQVMYGSVSNKIRKEMNSFIKSQINKTKGTMTFTIKKSSLKKNKIEIKTTAMYGKNKFQEVQDY